MHVNKSKSYSTRSAKIWLDAFEVFEQGDLTKKELAIALKILREYEPEFKEQINKFAKGAKVTTLRLK